MSWFAVWQNSNGALVSTGTVLGNPLAPGLSSNDFGTPQNIAAWNPATHDFTTVVVPLHSVLSQQAFWDRWTTAERQAFNCYAVCGRTTVPPSAINLQAPTALQLQIIEFQSYVQSAAVIDCNQVYIQTSVQQCETLTIIAVGRAAIITA